MPYFKIKSVFCIAFLHLAGHMYHALFAAILACHKGEKYELDLRLGSGRCMYTFIDQQHHSCKCFSCDKN